MRPECCRASLGGMSRSSGFPERRNRMCVVSGYLLTRHGAIPISLEHLDPGLPERGRPGFFSDDEGRIR